MSKIDKTLIDQITKSIYETAYLKIMYDSIKQTEVNFKHILFKFYKEERNLRTDTEELLTEIVNKKWKEFLNDIKNKDKSIETSLHNIFNNRQR